jgi:uncharacterized membrane protein YhaH (DUF805 family)
MNTFFSFQGRINRKPYWIANILLMLLSFAAMAALVVGALMLGLDTMGLRIATFVVQAALLYPTTAVLVKRLHDRDKSGWFAVALLAPAALGMALQFAGIGRGSTEPNILMTTVGFVILVVIVWFTIELGFLRGTAGANRFGPDPLGRVAEDRAATVAA